MPSLPTSEAENSDLELLRQLGKGNGTSFQVLYERYQGPIYRFSLHMAGDTATATLPPRELCQALPIVVRGPALTRATPVTLADSGCQTLTARLTAVAHEGVAFGAQRGAAGRAGQERQQSFQAKRAGFREPLSAAR